MKKSYQVPYCRIVKMEITQIIASSIGDFGGSGHDMPWGTAEELPYSDIPWEDGFMD